ncbi:MAG: glutathione S-transferase [Alphaproteobacteria bacterium]|nr:glutathione S-transferase [Alphaproteobacteria bacterium]
MRPAILYSFRRCPYAMRARLAVRSSGIECELREIILRDKASEFLAKSPDGTVPMLLDERGEVIAESLDIMLWALERSDPEGWLVGRAEALALISRMDLEFKPKLDRYKYARGVAATVARDQAASMLAELDTILAKTPYLCGQQNTLADMAIAPFIRQFANVARPWFDAQPWPALQRWLDGFITSKRFAAIMAKYPRWQAGDPITLLPQRQE